MASNFPALNADQLGERRNLVETTTQKLRDLILSREPGEHLGSLQDMSKTLGVGTVTLQQASRILEHEGLLEVRRGPGGGYIGTRPDDAALGRSIARFLEAHGSNYHEAIDIITMFDCEMLPEAARSTDPDFHAALRSLRAALTDDDTVELRTQFEIRFHDAMFKVIDRPLMELLARVTLRHYRTSMGVNFYVGEEGTAVWRAQRRRIIDAILDGDVALARFEGQRRREYLLGQLAPAFRDTSPRA